MKRLTKYEIKDKAETLVYKFICQVGMDNAIKILHVAWTKAREQKKLLKDK